MVTIPTIPTTSPPNTEVNISTPFATSFVSIVIAPVEAGLSNMPASIPQSSTSLYIFPHSYNILRWIPHPHESFMTPLECLNYCPEIYNPQYPYFSSLK